MEKEQIKYLIELSNDFKEADDIINKYTSLKTYEEKITYLKETFNCEIIRETMGNSHDSYIALLTAVINKKWL